ncbi:HTH-type transcriptional regulator SinR [Aliiroseovarius sp. xm-m-379]|uniref:helix-turn-helix domain-containing protein n=1 Tax=Aliiroseovarius TaxID=1658781 RepID=UPI001A0EB442|nr:MULTISPECIES: XRE family transcriptional regulator [Aliiroseovarius]NRP23432.1 HTH-type transcriptional regulator SinR [Aliiroseovarius sp. xm-m-379]NRP29322.1 HTH-type transcriptional regulator SinR [Aliiroseovarius sp. xm-m-314]NRP32231.1 HTH-type transcriptional regulator SinR [Aliiroseovarius sp. xm-a-104]NRP44046.1 HTH-type transcriptional regulator SinR [Aliiroseovarius sp. xm-m-378]NRP48652.1 HTH-type transcriptional regulator SinR [Aliiroseovarius sp. xm-m-354]
MEWIPREENIANADAEQAPDGEVLGKMIREARKEKGLTLEEAAGAAGIGRSTLSKIENNQTKPSFDIIRRLMQTLELETPQLFVQSAKSDISGRRDFTSSGKGEHKETRTYDHELLCNELTSKRMVPYISTIKAREAADFDGWVRHSGEEFMFVLSGTLTLYTEHYRPLQMGPGDSVYYDSGMGHGCVSTSEEDAKVLWVSLQD